MTGRAMEATPELIVMTMPVLRSIMDGRTARIRATGARTLTSWTRHQMSTQYHSVSLVENGHTLGFDAYPYPRPQAKSVQYL